MARRRKKPEDSQPAFHLETLERRILFSADAALTALEVVPEPDVELVLLRQSETDEAADRDSAQAGHAQATELIILDAALPDLVKILDDLARSEREGSQVVVLDAEADALTQISAILAEQRGVTALHVMSHGSSGVLELSGQRIGTLDLLSRADELAQWRVALAPGADVLLYGCEVAADGQGRQFVDTMARLTGADVSASSDLTGSSDRGGDWQLEYRQGDVQSEVALSPALQTGYDGTLVASTANSLKLADVTSIDSVDSESAELVFVQSDLAERDKLITDIRQDALDSGRSLSIVLLDSKRDGFEQIEATLAGYHNLEAIHFVTHGAHGLIQLGDSLLSASNVNHHISDIQSWRTALSESGDILIYGCDVAATDEGRWLVQQLGTLTGADVAASDDTTGHEDLGGDWILEYRYGELNTDVPLNDDAQASWYGALDIASNLLVHNTFDTDASDRSGNSYNGTLTNGAVIDTTGGTNQIGAGKVSFDGTDDYVDISTHVANFDNLTQGTIAVWVYADSASSNEVIFEASDSGDGNSRLAVIKQNDEFVVFLQEGNVTRLNAATTSVNLIAGTWNHVSVTVDASGNKVYINGVEQMDLNYISGTTSTNRFFDDVNDLDFMAWGVDKYNGSTFGAHFDGFLDDGRIYDRALSASDVTELYNYTGLPQTYTVTNTLDDGSPGSLRWAISQSNANVGADTIDFNIAGSGTQIISLSSALPSITEAVTIDATTQTGWVEQSFMPIVLDGNDGAFDGLTFTSSADNSEVRGLVIRDTGGDGIQIDDGASGILVAGNWIGQFNSDGTDAGVGEMIGGDGIFIDGDNNTIGGTTTADRNVINEGVYLYSISATNNVISGNYLGTDTTGNAVLASGGAWQGVVATNGAAINTIGGATDAHRNIISATNAGIDIQDSTTSQFTIQNNWIGLGADGSTVLGSGNYGIYLYTGDNHVIGGIDTGNVILDSGIAIEFAESVNGTIVQGNYIGIDETGTVVAGSHTGIQLEWDSINNTIGGISAGEGNVITANTNVGISTDSRATTVNNQFRGNSIYGNAGLGIDLQNNGVSANDAGDGDTGANNLQNWAVLNSADIADDGTFTYSLDTTTLAAGTYTIDFYASTDRDLGRVEGERYIGSITGVANGISALTGTLTGITLDTGEFVTLITTDASGNSSEFSTYAMAMDGDSDGVSPEDIKTTATTDGGLSINADGGDVYLVPDDSNSVMGGLTSLSYEIQFSGSDTGDDVMLASYATGSDSNEFSLFIRPSGNLANHLNGDYVSSSAMDFRTLLDGSQHTIGFTWDNASGDWAMYVDGALVDSGTAHAAGGTIDTGGTLVLGQEQDAVESSFETNQLFEGTLYNVRLFSDVRAAGEIASSYKTALAYDEDEMVAQWDFNNLSIDGIITDTVSGNNLTVKRTDEVGFTKSEAMLTFTADENALNGSVVGSLYGLDPQREAEISALLTANPNLHYSAETGKFYEYVGTGKDWATALADAQASTLDGVGGNLITINSASENQIVVDILNIHNGPQAWLAAADERVEGEWRWYENGSAEELFWKGDGDGYNIDGAYENWDTSNPNDATGQDYAKFFHPPGKWDDVDGTGLQKSIIEYDADAVLDATQALTYAITVQTVAGAFEIDADTGKIRVLDGSLLDADTQAIHTITVEVTDVNSNTHDKDFTISLKNLVESNNAPTDISSGIELNTDGGNDAYLIADDGGAILGGLTSMAIEVQFATDDTASFSPFFSYASPSNDNEFTLGFAGTEAYLYIADNDILLNSIDYNSLRDGTLQHLSISWDNTNGDWAVYNNGKLIEQGTGHEVGNTIESGGELVFGNDQDSLGGTFHPSQAFKGTLYDIRIWNHVLSAAEISRNHQQKFDTSNLPAGLIANWQMDGFNGSNDVVDVVSANNLSIGNVEARDIPNWTNQVGGVTANGNTLTYVDDAEPDGWGSQINSPNVSALGSTDNYIIRFTLDNTTNFAWAVGLGLTESSASFTDIDYAIFVDHIFGDVDIRHNGTTVGTYAISYAAGDEFGLYVNGTTLEYQHNGVLLPQIPLQPARIGT